MKRSPIKRHRGRRTAGRPNDRVDWRLNVLALAGGECEVPGEHAGRLEAHHVITQQAIEKRYRHLSLDELAELLWTADNGMAVCLRHHVNHHAAVERIPRSAVPARAVRFAAELELDWMLDRYYRTDEEAGNDAA